MPCSKLRALPLRRGGLPSRTARRPPVAVLSALIGCSALGEGRAAAFTIDSPFTSACHESITATALRGIRRELSTAPAIATSGDDLALIDDVPFSLDTDLRDIGSASLLIGARDNDLKGNAALSLDQLAQVHGNPDAQFEHCLRSPSEDEPQGSEVALGHCRDYIRARAREALGGLDASGVPDPGARADLSLVLSVRGSVTASLPLFYVRMGQALHALEDGFGHTYRTSDGMRVIAACNYVDVASGAFDERRDGPPHKAELDRCDDPDDLRARNHRLAIDAAHALLHAALDPTLDLAGKEAAIDDVLVTYLSYEPGCTFDNGWCDAPEARLPDGGACGCAVVGRSSGAASLGFSAAVAAMALARRAVRRRRRHRPRVLAWLCAALWAATPAPAAAQSAAPTTGAPYPTEPGAARPAAPVTPSPAAVEVVAEAAAAASPPPNEGEAPRTVVRLVTQDEARKERVEDQRPRFSFYIHSSVSVDKPALAGALAGRFQINDAWVVGLDGEFNPYYGVQSKSFRMGSFNAYGTVIRRFPLRFEAVNLRTTAHMGASVLLMDLYGAPKGSTGIFFGLCPLGIEWKVSRVVYLVLDPIEIAVPAPQLAGVPFVYQQYRTTFGVELAPW